MKSGFERIKLVDMCAKKATVRVCDEMLRLGFTRERALLQRDDVVHEVRKRYSENLKFVQLILINSESKHVRVVQLFRTACPLPMRCHFGEDS